MARLATVIIQIRHQIEAIQGWIGGRTFEDFTGDILWNVTQDSSLDELKAAVDAMSPDANLVPRADRPSDG